MESLVKMLASFVQLRTYFQIFTQCVYGEKQLNCCEIFTPSYVLMRGRCMRLSRFKQQGAAEGNKLILSFAQPESRLVDDDLTVWVVFFYKERVKFPETVCDILGRWLPRNCYVPPPLSNLCLCWKVALETSPSAHEPQTGCVQFRPGRQGKIYLFCEPLAVRKSHWALQLHSTVLFKSTSGAGTQGLRYWACRSELPEAIDSWDH